MCITIHRGGERDVHSLRHLRLSIITHCLFASSQTCKFFDFSFVTCAKFHAKNRFCNFYENSLSLRVRKIWIRSFRNRLNAGKVWVFFFVANGCWSQRIWREMSYGWGIYCFFRFILLQVAEPRRDGLPSVFKSHITILSIVECREDSSKPNTV